MTSTTWVAAAAAATAAAADTAAAAVSPFLSSSTSPSARVPLPVWIAGVRTSALASELRLFRVPDFLSRRLIVSALYIRKASASGSDGRDWYDREKMAEMGSPSHLLVSSRRGAFRLRAVSSRRSAISATFSCFFLREVSSLNPSIRPLPTAQQKI